MTDLTMTCDEFEAAVPDRMDGTLAPRGVARMDAHAASCTACASLLADLTAIRAEAARLPGIAPVRDLWAGIAERIEAPVVPLPVVAPARRPAFANRARLAAAAAILVAATAGITWSLSRGALAPAAATEADTGFSAAMAYTRHASNATRPPMDQTYEREIATLREIVDRRRTELDSATVTVLEKNLKVIDDAIANCKAALAKDPASGFLLDRLTDAYDSKLRTLRAVAAMPQRG
jgi:anti-sigma factor RsiW